MMTGQSRLLTWFALVFFVLLALLSGMMLTSQKSISPASTSSNAPVLDLNNLFGITK